MSTKNAPIGWADMGFPKPDENDYPGAFLNLPGGRVLVRSYSDRNYGTTRLIDDADGWYLFDSTLIPVLETKSIPVIGDTIFYLGEVRGDDAINLWCPMRVVWVDSQRDGFVSVKTIRDTSVTDNLIEEECLPLHLLTDKQRDVIAELAMSLNQATDSQTRILMEIFNCEWVLERA